MYLHLYIVQQIVMFKHDRFRSIPYKKTFASRSFVVVVVVVVVVKINIHLYMAISRTLLSWTKVIFGHQALTHSVFQSASTKITNVKLGLMIPGTIII